MAHKAPDPIVAAGSLVARGDGGDTEVLLVHRPKYGDWSLPKGKTDPGEHVLQAAVREVHEETGVHIALRRPLPSRQYVVDDQLKIVHFWRSVVTGDDGFVPTDEIDQIRWLPVAEAAQLATHPADSAVIMHVLEPAGTPFLVLRHAKAKKRSNWDGPDVDRPLDRTGVSQAKRLVPLLAAYGIVDVHSSAAARCVATVVPYAKRAGRDVVAEDDLTEEAFEDSPQTGLDRAAALMAKAASTATPTVLCGHRPVMPAIIAELLEGSGLVGPTDTMPTGSFIAVHVVGEVVGDHAGDGKREGVGDGVVAVEQHLLP